MQLLAMLALAGVPFALAHGGDTHAPVEPAPGDSWQVRHMKLEHGLEDFDAQAFFTLHDNDNSKTWTREDILNLYGLLKVKQLGDGSGLGDDTRQGVIDDALKDKVYRGVLQLVDANGDGIITQEEWINFAKAGGELADYGVGPGHHGDYEYEYEVHHWQKYHKDVDPDVKIVHPEDIEHERLYHQFEHGDAEGDAHDGSGAKLQRIPKKFLKQQ